MVLTNKNLYLCMAMIHPMIYVGLEGTVLGVDQMYPTIVEAVASEFNVTVNQIFLKSRKRELVDCRRCIAFILREFYQLTYHTIAKKFKCDHSTIVHGVQKTHELLQYDQHFQSKFISITSKLNIQF